MKLTFWGGVKMVTGSSFLLENEAGKRILIDCGLHQGARYCERHNFEPFPLDPASIEAVFVTHAHIDHIGRLPQLYRAGFRGKIYSTPPTKDFAETLLIDSEHILAIEARELGLPPIYELADINETMKLWQKVSYHEKVEAAGFEVEFYNAGHILGSASILVSGDGKKIVFSGDLGHPVTPLIKGREEIGTADYALIDSTYGSRVHEGLTQRKDLLENVIEETVKAGGVLMIPAFALERTQELLYELNDLVENGRIPRTPVFIDSPLAIKLTAVYKKYSKDQIYFDEAAIELLRAGDAIFDFPDLHLTLTTEQSKQINSIAPPKIIIAGAGMSQGGRILHHERRYLPDPKSTILFVSFQAVGSLGRRILDGAKSGKNFSVKIFGEEIAVKARVLAIGGYSSHADQPALLDWLRPMKLGLKKVFLVHGEEKEMGPLEDRIRDELAVQPVIPNLGEEVIL
ncbi:MAG TPA: MBL fold metallo-hydrolase [Candidatus Paceibacterota bacterium]